MIRCVDISKSFNDAGRTVDVLRTVSLEVEGGSTCAIMGPSGSGKSTLLYCLAGLEPVDAGEVSIGGRDLTAMSRSDLARLRRAEVGFVFQSYNLIPSLSTFDNVALPFRLQGLRPPEEQILAVLDDMGLVDVRDRFPAKLSGGEQQRVALARVVVASPAVIFADEPTGALDTPAARIVLDLLHDMGAAPDRAMLLATHDPQIAAECDRVVLLRHGTLAAQLDPAGSAEQVTRRFAELRQQEQRG